MESCNRQSSDANRSATGGRSVTHVEENTSLSGPQTGAWGPEKGPARACVGVDRDGINDRDGIDDDVLNSEDIDRKTSRTQISTVVVILQK